jgi:ATP phosphoribosyltransferase
MASQALILAVPSKGRLQEQVANYLADAGLNLKQSTGARDYRATLDGQPGVDVKLMSSAEIATALGNGEVHLGITGEDLIREDVRDSNEAILLLQPLGFGFADVVVAVPRAWIDVSTMADLDDVCTAFHARHHRRLRVATKYLQLTRAFFAAHGIADYRIVESLGATEGAPAAGLAEAIVDITTTGATLSANDLKVLEDGLVLKSQAQLAASLRASWNIAALEAADRLTARIAARELARSSYLLRVALPRSGAKIVQSLEKDCGCSVLLQNGAEHVLLCPRSRLSEAVGLLRGKGVHVPVAAERADYVFAEVNQLTNRLRQALKR